MSRADLSDLSLERAHAAEAVFEWHRFAAHGLVADDFESGACRAVIESAYEAWEVGETGIDGVVRALQRSGKAGVVGGRQGLLDLVAESGAPDAERMRHLRRLRGVQAAAVDAARVAGAGDLPGALERLQEALQRGTRSDRAKVKTAGELVEGVIQGIVQRSAGSNRRVHPGLECVLSAVGELPVGSMTVVGADSGVGKSSLALEMCIGSAERGQPAGLIGVEDPEDVTGSRLLGALAQIDSRAIQSGSVNDGQRARLMQAMAHVQRLSPALFFADCTGGTELDVMGAMTQMASRGARMIAVDYLTEIQASKHHQDRRNEIRSIAKALKAHAKRLNVALVLVSQIARPEGRNANIKPTKHHLKESGDVTNMAEVILLLWREQEDDSAAVKAWVAKCKWGGLGGYWEMRRTNYGRLVEHA